jgi:hypothetical protein
MRTMIRTVALALVLLSGSGTASGPKTGESESAPIKCYEYVQGGKDRPGLGLNVGQAVELCGGATDAQKVIQCFVKAWAHRDDGGLGLNAGQAVDLCKTK